MCDCGCSCMCLYMCSSAHVSCACVSISPVRMYACTHPCLHVCMCVCNTVCLSANMFFYFYFLFSSSVFRVFATLKQLVMSVPTRLWSVRPILGTAAANPGLPMGYAGCLCSGLWPTAGDRNGKGLSGGFGGQHYLIPLPFLSRDFSEHLGLPIR